MGNAEIGKIERPPPNVNARPKLRLRFGREWLGPLS
jgi:hypothetical protein